MKKLALIILLTTVQLQASLTTALLLGAGALGLANLFLSESDEKIVTRVQEEYKNLYNTYIDQVEYLQREYHVSAISVSERLRVLHDFSEEKIYNFAVILWNKGIKIEAHRYDLETLITNLYKDVHTLEKKKKTLREKTPYNKECTYLLNQIEDVISRVHQGLPFFELLHDYLDYHKHYLVLFQEEDLLRKQYAYELELLDEYRNYSSIIHRKLTKAVERYAAQTQAVFAYTEYLERLERDLRTLKPSINRVDSRYNDRKQWAQRLYDSLYYINRVIASDPTYQAEKREYGRR